MKVGDLVLIDGRQIYNANDTGIVVRINKSKPDPFLGGSCMVMLSTGNISYFAIKRLKVINEAKTR